MELILDTADTQEIEALSRVCKIAGITTNPTIIIATGKEAIDAACDVIACLQDDQKFFMQVIATDFEGMMEDARLIASLREKNVYVKIPCTPVGLEAIKACTQEGIPTLGTVVFTPEQGLLAAINGAEYIAPYVNRISMYADGVAVATQLADILYVQGIDAKVMGASFHNASQVHDLAEAGCKALTLPPKLLHTIIENPTTAAIVDDFSAAWQKSYGRNSLA